MTNKPEPPSWEQDHISDISKKADSLPEELGSHGQETHTSPSNSHYNNLWFKDLTQVKRFVRGRAFRAFITEPTPEEKERNEMIDNIFGLEK